MALTLRGRFPRFKILGVSKGSSSSPDEQLDQHEGHEKAQDGHCRLAIDPALRLTQPEVRAEAMPEGEAGRHADEPEGDQLPSGSPVAEQVAGIPDALERPDAQVDARSACRS